MPGILYVCSTPIGNLGDVTRRLTEVLDAADVIYAEDTRRTARLLQQLGIDADLRSYFAGNEETRAEELAKRIGEGAAVALVTDAGTPAISDPGLSAVNAAVAAGGIVVPIPGPSAVTALLSVSGLPSERFVFEGFLPRKGKARSMRLEEIAEESRTVVFFTTGKRLVGDLFDLAEFGVGPERRLAIGRELTKLHEEIWRGALGDALTVEFEERGEFTVALQGGRTRGVSIDDAVLEARRQVDAGASVKSAAADVAAQSGLPRRKIYERLIKR